jgi:alkylation response protein AidB-like acyl-CoA dehydrogenase
MTQLSETLESDSSNRTATTSGAMETVDVVAAAQALKPQLAAAAVAVDRDRTIPREHYHALRDARLFDILKPKKYGGLELSVHEHALVTLELAEVCASTAWVYSILAGDNMIILGYPEETQDEIWGENRHATLAGSIFLNPHSGATKVKGGYRLTGRWGFNSGSDFAEWLVLTAAVDGGDVPYSFLLPTSDATIVDDWFPTGMRGTGSRTVETHDLFIPEHRAMPGAEVFAREDRKALHPTFDALHTPSGGYGKFGFAGVAVGAANGAVKHFMDTAAGSTRVATALGGQLRLIDQDYVACEFAEAAEHIRMATQTIVESSKRVAQQVRRREPVTRMQLAQDFLENAYVTSAAVRTVQTVSALLGAKTGFPEHPVSRAKRDIEMLSHHVTLNWRQAAVQFTAATCNPTDASSEGLAKPR